VARVAKWVSSSGGLCKRPSVPYREAVRHVVLVAPRFAPNTLRYIAAFADLPGAEVSLISEDPESRLPPGLRERIAGHYGVRSALDAGEIARAGRAIGKAVGPIDRLVGVLEQLQIPMAEAREKLGIEGMTLKIATRFRDKDAMKDVLRRAGVPVARSILASTADELKAFVREVGFPVVVKPQAGLGSRATFRIASEAQLGAMLSMGFSPSPQKPAQVEEFVQGREFTCETVTIGGRPIWRSGTRYFPGPLEVLENPWIQYCVMLPREDDDPTFTRFHEVNKAALQALGMGTGLTHMEWFLKDDGRMVVSEVGARPPGVHIMPLMNLAHDTDMIAAWAELMTFDRFEPKDRKYAAGVAFFRCQGNGQKVASVRGIEAMKSELEGTLVEMVAPRVGMPRAEGYEGEGYAIVRHATTEGVRAALHRLVSEIRVDAG
jgi:biotin carboxylase